MGDIGIYTNKFSQRGIQKENHTGTLVDICNGDTEREIRKYKET